ncbi:hypothetical protein ACHAXT_011228 [Thalassiosira profunda]
MKFSTAATTMYLCGKKARAVVIGKVDDVAASDSASSGHAGLRPAKKHGAVDANPKSEADAGILGRGGASPAKTDAGILTTAVLRAKVRSLEADTTTCDAFKDTPGHGHCTKFCETYKCMVDPDRKDCVAAREKFVQETSEERLPCDPTASPTQSPTATPTKAPTSNPTKNPTVSPTKSPTPRPVDVCASYSDGSCNDYDCPACTGICAYGGEECLNYAYCSGKSVANCANYDPFCTLVGGSCVNDPCIANDESNCSGPSCIWDPTVIDEFSAGYCVSQAV